MENIESFDAFVNEAKDLSKKEVRDLKVKINNASTIGKYFTKDEVKFLLEFYLIRHLLQNHLKFLWDEVSDL